MRFLRNVVRVTAFVDWDTARRVVRPEARLGRSGLLKRPVASVQEQMANALHDIDRGASFRVDVRLYHGWHRGKTKTSDRLDLERFVVTIGAQRVLDRVSFSSGFSYGDAMLCSTHRGPLFDTLRRREDGTDEQKMVDTALVSDLLHFAHSKVGDLALVVGDDDDLLPAVFTAEVWKARVFVLRMRLDDNRNLRTAGLIMRMG